MKYRWEREELTPDELKRQTGCTVKSISREDDGLKAIEVEFDQQPTQGQLARLDSMFGQVKREGVPPKSLHIAALTAVDAVNKKGTVVRKWMGENYAYEGCYVSLQALEAYQAGKIKLFDTSKGINAPENADSFVLVYFVSENPYDEALEIPVIMDKLVK